MKKKTSKKTTKTTIKKTPRTQLKTRQVAKKIIAAEKQWGDKLDKLLDEWKSHIHEQIALHEKILSGRHPTNKLLQDTINMEKKFIEKVRKIK